MPAPPRKPLIAAVELLEERPTADEGTEEEAAGDAVAVQSSGELAAAEPSEPPAAAPLADAPLYKGYEPTDKEHYPAAGIAEVSAFNRTVEQYEAPGFSSTLTLPRMEFKTRKERTTFASRANSINFGHHNGGWGLDRQVPPGEIQAGRFVKPLWNGRPWVPPESCDTTWDFKLDQPVSPLLLGPAHWDSLPLVEETVHPEERREATDVNVVDDDHTGSSFAVSPNLDVDMFPVSNVQRPHYFSKQYGMPMVFQRGPVQWAGQLYPPAKMPVVEKTMHIPRSHDSPGQDMEIFCIGDTLTLGHTYGSDEYQIERRQRNWMEQSEMCPREHPYALRLQELINCNVSVAAVYGETTDTMRDRLLRQLEGRRRAGAPQPRVLIIWAGLYDFMDPGRTAEDTAQNLMRMHHVAHAYGCRTVSVGLPEVSKKPWMRFMGARILQVNKILEDFARDRKRQMCCVDMFGLVPHRMKGSSNMARDDHGLPTRAARIGPVWFTNHIQLTPLGYDRVGELIFKRLKHQPGFLREAIPDRHYDHPCTEALPDDMLGQAWERDLLSRARHMRRRTTAHPDSFGSSLANKLSPYREQEGRADPNNADFDSFETRTARGFANYLRGNEDYSVSGLGRRSNVPLLPAPPSKARMSQHH